ncbi:IS1380 family transposase [Kribbella sp. NPDC050124]|uniref:IS1380 family transposase n=1 Tax=Kribbella sp. NPDC050124 TaxID=3364114 RepID=UPI0037B3B3BD
MPVGAPRFVVSGDGDGVASRAGVVLLRELASACGLADQVTNALADTYKAAWLHAPGQVFADLAVAVADGETSMDGIERLRERGQLHGGVVASDSTAWRLLERMDAAHLGRVRQARAAARARAWAAGAAPAQASDPDGWLTMDVDASVVPCHSDKENAAATWKKSYGFHPLMATLDRSEISSGEFLAGLLRPGNAGSDTAADHIEVLDLALEQLPAPVRPGTPDAPSILVRSDSAGATHAFAAYCREQRVGFSFGKAVDVTLVAIADAIDDRLWQPAVNTDGSIRDGAWVVEVTGSPAAQPVLSAFPDSTRLILRKERPHPGAQLGLHNTTREGMRLTAFITDTPAGIVPRHVAGLDLRHRQHARVEDRIKDAKATGLNKLPAWSFQANAAWLEIVAAAADLICWTKLLGFADTPSIARTSPATFRDRVLHIAAKITTTGRRIRLHLDATSRYAADIVTGWTRLRHAFT